MNNSGTNVTFTPSGIANAQWRLYSYIVTCKDKTVKQYKRRVTVFCPIQDAAIYGAGSHPDEIATREKLAGASEFFERLQIKRKVKRKELADFYSAMAKNLRVKMPLSQTLQRCVTIARTAYFRGVLATLCLYILKEGGQLSKGMKLFPEAFDDVAIALVEAGESSGNIVEIFDRLAASAKEAVKLANRITGMMAYPAVLAVVFLCVIAVVQFFMLPRLMPMFESMMTSQMPLSTRIVMRFGEITQSYPWLLGIVIVFMGFLVSKRKEMMKTEFYQKNVLKVPVIGDLIRDYAMLRAIRTLALMLKSVVSPELTWNVAARTTGNVTLSDYFKRIYKRTKDGASLEKAFYAERHILKDLGIDLAYQMGTAQNTGRPADELDEVADYLHSSVNTRLDVLPVVMNMSILIAAMPMVLMLALAIVQPTLIMANDVMSAK